MTDELELTFDVAIRAGLDAVWDLLSTSDGRAAWFGTEAEIDLVVGGASRITWSGEQAIDATVTHVEPRRHLRLAYVEDGQELGVEEYWLEHDDGVTNVRLIQTMPGPAGDGWDEFHGDLERGWRLFLASLRFAAERAVTPHRSAACRYIPVTGPRTVVWRDLLLRLGLDAGDPPTVGATIASPVIADAQVELIDPPSSLLLTTPRRTLLVDLEGSSDQLVAYVQAATHGEDADDDGPWRDRAIEATRRQ